MGLGAYQHRLSFNFSALMVLDWLIHVSALLVLGFSYTDGALIYHLR